ncbi:esterase/lipase family protein [Rhodococcus sp. NPDC003994]|uniref:Alpha/beta fold hydrolase n=1 Tax=Rhodococcoides kroppenstedtii TaxID=293050 RepID=A0ABS7NS25_9NOCA|nr:MULTISPECIES: alpha/beta fold hydrolase [Rhodococcus]AMY17858.1 Extracellular esterase EstB [Rhodococcus sp. PBTS 1]MBY6313123.1 alpha/beta fold hydrolase [Rhodococcus kroppenstedtii]MBY6320810.1 alpha/beta fold hydrolase [Rhodococcus kroppenstedtii]MBY6399713.1 alpha/beta fold hydrolase [Rhodococcus kroppenstedtii]MBY6437586.1 alpha/beta fold hydrolase [Rhodococcus kroppenstedtii]
MVCRARSLFAAVTVASAVALGGGVAQADPAVTVPGPSDVPLPGAATDLPGADDPSCVPSPQHPNPVVLVHGTWSNARATWSTLAPELQAQGYCVFALNYGQPALLEPDNLLRLWGGADIRDSAKQLATFVDAVRERTGAAKVDIVGHSQGGTMARQYLKFEGGADLLDPARNKVDKLVTLGATNHGTTYDEKQLLGKLAELVGFPVQDAAAVAVGPSAVQQMVGSPFLEVLNAGGDTMPGITYTVVASHNDTVSTPPENTFLAPGPGATVSNEWVQDGCPGAAVDHMGLTSEPAAASLVLEGLDPSFVADRPASCSTGE